MRKICIGVLAVLFLVPTSCDVPKPCRLSHYESASNCRSPKSFLNDTLSMNGLMQRYFDLVDGDTIVVKGYLNPYRYSEEIHEACGRGTENQRYLSDYPIETDTINYSALYDYYIDMRYIDFYQGEFGNGHVNFFERLHLFVVPDTALWRQAPGTEITITGVFLLGYILNEVDGCEETCALQPLEWSSDKIVKIRKESL